MTLIVAPTAEPVTLAELKAQLGIATADQASDTVLLRRITEARKWAEGYTGRSFMPQVHELRLDAFPACGEIPLPFPPVTEITSIKYIATDGTLTTIDAADYTLDSSGYVHFVRPVYGVTWPRPRAESGAVRVRYATGYAVTALDAAKTLSAITVANPGVVTSTAHGFAAGDLLRLDITGMAELDGLLYRARSVATNSFELAHVSGSRSISTLDNAAFTAGTAQRVAVDMPEILVEAICILVGHWTNYQGRLESGQFITRVPLAVEQMLDSVKIWSLA